LVIELLVRAKIVATSVLLELETVTPYPFVTELAAFEKGPYRPGPFDPGGIGGLIKIPAMVLAVNRLGLNRVRGKRGGAGRRGARTESQT
jgi:hypothetical protein